MKKILFISKYAGFKGLGYPTRQYFLANELAKKYLEVMLIGSRSSMKFSEPFFGLKKVITEPNLTCVQLNGPLINLGFNLKRIFSWLIFELNVFLNFNYFRKFKPNVILVSSLSILTMFTGVLFKKFLKVPLIIEVRDIYPLTLIEVGKFTPQNPFVAILSWVERFGYRNADYFISPLENFGQHVQSIIPNPAPFMWIPMGFDDFYMNPELTAKGSQVIDTLCNLKSEGKFIVAHAGAIGLANDLERLFKIADSKIPDNIHFVFLGDGPLKNEFFEKYGHLTNINFIDSIPKQDVPKVLAYCDLLINPWKELPIYRFGVSPNKWIDYALSKRPFLTTLQAKLSITQLAGNCFVTPDSSDESLRAEIIRIAELPPEQLSDMGQKGYDYVTQNLSYAKLASDLNEVIDNAIIRYKLNR